MALGFKSVKECQERITATEFAEWQAFDAIAPFGAERLPIYFGTIAATTANTLRQKESDHVFTWRDFFPPYHYHEPNQTVDEQIAIVEMLNEAFGGIDKRGERETLSA